MSLTTILVAAYQHESNIRSRRSISFESYRGSLFLSSNYRTTWLEAKHFQSGVSFVLNQSGPVGSVSARFRHSVSGSLRRSTSVVASCFGKSRSNFLLRREKLARICPRLNCLCHHLSRLMKLASAFVVRRYSTRLPARSRRGSGSACWGVTVRVRQLSCGCWRVPLRPTMESVALCPG